MVNDANLNIANGSSEDPSITDSFKKMNGSKEQLRNVATVTIISDKNEEKSIKRPELLPINNYSQKNDEIANGSKSPKKPSQSLSSSSRKRSISHGKHVISTKDIRTAFMLFVVTFLFILFYLPSLLATNDILPIGNLVLIYFYSYNSAINPIIYCFLNPNFRADLAKLFIRRGFLYDKCTKQINLNAK
jgi:hypothetical protein